MVELDVKEAYLVWRAQEGYLHAFSELVPRCRASTYRVTLRLLHDLQRIVGLTDVTVNIAVDDAAK